ncbi:hypothetical protein TTHERM_00420150 (macronuclear) [Tetrahymena thermophila SB210]|uniref:Uncharacterized protein n=1 Tax=Tetrahymena thermophila (strain SB210) TaxID=312017 RepID=I7MGZ1_TETTS|nr:hypothetical protein TTHERM_00420150 [Tetrahymena thermophila SB210]EAR85607.1 hypothetical protein TTHERM_00420150 [Tetrahymena thermophila SB210]|eukprot:XP_001033270.1 hypothetical protein TTHERM_00420150 [Tetrahymena thermophila SB210]
MQENSQIQNDVVDIQQLNSKINKYERDIIKLKEKNQELKTSVSDVSEKYKSEKNKNDEYELEKKHFAFLLQQKDEELNRLQEHSKTQQLELQYFENILYQHAETQQQEKQIVEKQIQHYKQIYKKYVDLEIQIENVNKENLLLKSDLKLAESKFLNQKQQCQDIQQIYNNRLIEFQQQFESMNSTISILQRQVDENKYFKDFMQSQIQLNQDIEANIEESSIAYKNINSHDDFNENVNSRLSSQKMIPEYDQNQINNLLEENMLLSQQLSDYETKITPKILQKEQELKVLQEQLKDLQKYNQQLNKENDLNKKELQEIKQKQMAQMEKEELQNMPASQFTEKDIQQLQKAYIEEKEKRISYQQTLKEIQEEMKRKNPIIRKQNEKWLKLNQEFLRFEQEYGEMQKLLAQKNKNVDSLQDELERSLNENVQLQSQISFLKEEIQRLAVQINHLLKINSKFKQNISAKFGKNQLEEIMQQIKKEKNQQFGIKDIDEIYQTNYQSIYSDIQEVIEMNMALSKKLRERS